jgi:putative membrane protein
MIKRYSDHAANERTFLAWVRTAIAVMAFGFLVERFDLFIRFASREMADGAQLTHGRNLGDWAGLAFVFMGLAMIVVAALRFFRTAKQIDAETESPGPGVRFDLALAALLVLLGCSLALYLPQAGLGSHG